MTDPNQRQRQILSPFAIQPASQTPQASPETVPQSPGGTDPSNPVYGGSPQVLLRGQTTPVRGQTEHVIPSQQVMPSQQIGGSVVHPGFGSGLAGSMAAQPGPQVQSEFGVATGIAPVQQHPSIQAPVAPSQAPITQQGTVRPGPIETTRPGLGSSGLTHPAFGAPVGRIGAQSSMGTLQTEAPSAEQASFRTPPMTVFDEGEDLVIEFELPGVSKKDIELVGRQRGVSLKAAAEPTSGEGDVVASEGARRVYQREVPLDVDVVADDVSASFQNGILKVTLPKKEPTAGPKAVEIQ